VPAIHSAVTASISSSVHGPTPAQSAATACPAATMVGKRRASCASAASRPEAQGRPGDDPERSCEPTMRCVSECRRHPSRSSCRSG
jgi:hypothetical protein